MGSKREFLRDHKFTVMDYVVFYGGTPVVTLPVFYVLIWLMDLGLGVTPPVDAIFMLIFLAFLLSACAGISVALAVVRHVAQKQGRSK